MNESYQKWVTKLFEYNFEIQFRPGLENKAADALSRIPISIELGTLMVPNRLDTSVVYSQVEANPHLAKIWLGLLVNPDAYPWYSLDHGLLVYKGCLVLPKASPLILTLLQEGMLAWLEVILGSCGLTNGSHGTFFGLAWRMTSKGLWKSVQCVNKIKSLLCHWLG